MAWQDVVTPIVRYAINDVDDPQRYNDNRIQQAWLIGANYITQEFTLPNTYTIDIPNTGINPDPTPHDMWTVNLAALRAAIFMIGNDLKLAANSSWSIKDVHMTADFKDLYKANQAILDEIKSDYQNLRMQYMVGVQPQLAAILTPINILGGFYRSPGFVPDYRDRMIY